MIDPAEANDARVRVAHVARDVLARRRVDPRSGRVLQSEAMPRTQFGEGLTLHDGRCVQLLWHGGKGLVRDPKTFKVQHQFELPEGCVAVPLTTIDPTAGEGEGDYLRRQRSKVAERFSKKKGAKTSGAAGSPTRQLALEAVEEIPVASLGHKPGERLVGHDPARTHQPPEDLGGLDRNQTPFLPVERRRRPPR